MTETAAKQNDEFSAKFTDNPDLKFQDLSDELYRSYCFADGSIVTITNPVAVCVKQSSAAPKVGASQSHRVVDQRGMSHYIAPGWLQLSWCPRAGKKAVAY